MNITDLCKLCKTAEDARWKWQKKLERHLSTSKRVWCVCLHTSIGQPSISVYAASHGATSNSLEFSLAKSQATLLSKGEYGRFADTIQRKLQNFLDKEKENSNDQHDPKRN